MTKTIIKAVKDLTELEKQTVWETIRGHIDPTIMEFSNATDMESMLHFQMDAIKTLDTYKATPLDVAGMKAFAMQCFIYATQNVEVKH